MLAEVPERGAVLPGRRADPGRRRDGEGGGPGGGPPRRRLPRQAVSGERVLSADETAQVETRISDMGFYPYRTTDEELEEIWDNPEAVHAVFLKVMRETLTRWLDLAEQRLAGTGIRLYAMTGNDDPPELQGMLRDSPVLTETEEGWSTSARASRWSPSATPTRRHGTPRASWPTTSSSGASRRWPPQVEPAGTGRLQPARPARPHRHRPGPGPGRHRSNPSSRAARW